MSLTVTETRVEERLKPQPVAYSPQKMVTKYSVPYSLMRSASFDRLRQFPTYFCRNGSAEIYQWIFSSKTKLATTFSHVAKQIQQLLLTVAVFGGLGLLVLQLVACLLTVASLPMSIGLNFLLTCVFLIGSLACQAISHYKPTPMRPSRPLVRRKTTTD